MGFWVCLEMLGFGIGESTGFGFLGVCSNIGMVIGLLIFLYVYVFSPVVFLCFVDFLYLLC